MSADESRPVVRQLWHSNDGGRTWTLCDVRAGSMLAGGVGNGIYNDGWGNLYSNGRPAGDR